MKKRVSSLVLALALVLTLLPAAAMTAGATYDDTAGHWAEQSINRWSDHKIVQGNNGSFDPNGALTRGQMAVILARLLNLPAAPSANFTDVDREAWYADAIDRCFAAGILLGNDGKAMPDEPITREQAMVMLGRALGIQPIENPDLSKYPDAADVADYARGYVAALTEAGIVGGTAAGTVAPKDNIDRASTVTILDRAISAYADEDGQSVTASGGIVIVTADNVTVTAKAGTTVIVTGSGVTVKGEADNVIVTGENAGVDLNGADVQKVTVTGKDAEVTASNGAKVDTVTVSDKAEGTTVNAGSGTTIGTVENEGEGTTVTGSGKVENVESSEDVTVETKGTTVENTGDSEISVTDKNGKENNVTSGESSTVTNTTTGGGSSSGSGSTGGGSTGGGSSEPSTPSTPAFTHDYSTGWASDDTYHWHWDTCCDNNDKKDICEEPDGISGKATHTAASAATCTDPSLCKDCGYVMATVLGHDFVLQSTDEDGTAHYKCSRCPETLDVPSNAEAVIGENYYETLEAAVEAANAAEGDDEVCILLLKDVEVSERITISRAKVVLDGNGKTIKATNGWTETNDSNKHLLSIEANDVELINVTLDCNNLNAWGLQAYHCDPVRLTKVTVTNLGSGVGVPLTVNGAHVEADTLSVPKGTWGSINVDGHSYSDGKTGLSAVRLTLTGENGVIWTDNGNTIVYADDNWQNGTVAVEISGYEAVWVPSDNNGNGSYVWTNDVSACQAVIEHENRRQIFCSTLEAAANKAADGDTIRMLADVANSDAAQDKKVSINLKQGVTLEGDGHTIEGNIQVKPAAAGNIGIHNVVFENIHNNETLTGSYGFTAESPKTGKLTAILCEGLTGELDILECTFDSVDWDAIQITPAAGAKINIWGNTFKTTSGTIKPIRYVHIESKTAKDNDNKTYPVTADFTVNVNGNQFLNVSKLNQTGLEVYWAPDDALNETNPKLNLGGNYMDAPMAVCIGIGQGEGKYYNYNNAWYAAYDFFRNSADVNKENPDDSDFYSRDDMYMMECTKGNMLYTSAQAAVAAGAVAAVNKGDKGNVAYMTLAAAVAAAEPGDTVTLLKDTEGDGIVIAEGKFKVTEGETDWKGLTIDFGSYTYTVSGALVGSTNTETNGFQILKDNNVTLKNGKLTTAATAHKGSDASDVRPAHMLIQNYADLALVDMKLTGVSADKPTKYAISNNCGNVYLDGCTIIAAEGQYAFDVYGGFGDYDDVHVTVKGGTVTGNISVNRVAGSENNNENTLAMDKTVTFTGKLIVANYETDKTGICLGVEDLDADPWNIGAEINENGTYLFADGVMQTAADTYQISNLEGLKWMYNALSGNTQIGSANEMISGKTFQITKDIDATGYTWGCLHLGLASTASAVNGFTIDGMSHAINNLTITGQGLFTGYASGTYEGSAITTIKGITFDHVTLNSPEAHHVGVIWGELASELKLENVNVTNSAITGKCNVAALVGRNSGDVAAKLTFTSCSATDNTITAAGGTGADPDGASAFLGSALTNGPAFELTFGEGNTQSGNNMTQANGQVGGGVYATWEYSANTTSVVNDFTDKSISGT